MDKYALTEKEQKIAGADTAAILLEKHLADRLGYIDVELSLRGELVGRFPGEKNRTYLPRWLHDDGAAFRLQIEQGIKVGMHNKWATASTLHGSTNANYADHRDKFAAARAATVEAAAIKLEAELADKLKTAASRSKNSPSMG